MSPRPWVGRRRERVSLRRRGWCRVGGRRWRWYRLTGDAPVDIGLRRLPEGWRRRRRRRRRWLRDRCRGEADAQFGHLDASFLPGESQARKPDTLAAEGQAQHQRVDQQRKCQRQRQPPGCGAHGLAALRAPRRMHASTRRALRRWSCQRGAETSVTLIRPIVLSTPAGLGHRQRQRNNASSMPKPTSIVKAMRFNAVAMRGLARRRCPSSATVEV